MFAALKEKLKGAIKKFSRDVEEKSEVIKAPETEHEKEHKELLDKPFSEKKEEHKEKQKKDNIEEKKEEKTGFFSRLKSVFSGKSKEEEIKEKVHEIETAKEEDWTEETKEEKGESIKEKEESTQLKEESTKEKKIQPHEKKATPSHEEDFLEEYITDMEEKPTYGVDIGEKGTGEKSIEEKKFTEKSPEERKFEEKKFAEKSAEEKKHEEKWSEEKKFEEKKTQDKKTEEKKPEEAKKVEIPFTHYTVPHVDAKKHTEKEFEKELEKTQEKKQELKQEKRYEFPYKTETSWAEKKKELDIKIERRRREIAEAQKKAEFERKSELEKKSESDKKLELDKKEELHKIAELNRLKKEELKVTIEHEVPVLQKIERQVEKPAEERLQPSIQKTETKGIKTEPSQEKEQKEELEKEEKKSGWGIFTKITDLVTKTVLNESKFEEIFWEMEIVLLENNIAVEVIEKIKHDLKIQIVGKPIKRGKVEEVIIEAVGNSIDDLFSVEKIDLIEKITEKRKKGEPFVIAFVGVNGSGKTTTIAKMAKLFLDNRLKPVIAASDTFRAAAIQQLEAHAVKLGVKLIKHDYGSDPAAVAYDAIKFALQKSMDVVMIDTAGRLHSNVNLMDEMKKIIRVAKPDMKLFIGEAITGNDCVEQARQFNEAIGIDGIILCKADVDDKGGAAISVSYITGKPILYLGVGQGYDDLKEFDKNLVLKSLDLSEAME